MTKRVSMAGKGREMFTPTAPQKSTSTEAKNTKTGFYLPPEMVSDIDQLWIRVRQGAPKLKITKSQIVARMIDKNMKTLSEKPIEEVLSFLS